MKVLHDAATTRRVLGQGRILEALPNDEAVLTGTLDSLARRFDLTPDDLRTCLRELLRAGWVVVQTQPFHRLTVRLERRSHPASSVAVERRRGVPSAWQL
jgi:hypothetical protein